VSAVLTPTRRPVLGRFAARWRCVKLRWLIRHAEKDLAQHQREFEHASRHLPAQIAHDRAYIAALAKQLHKEVLAQ